jgi:hypothetical protein
VLFDQSPSHLDGVDRASVQGQDQCDRLACLQSLVYTSMQRDVTLVQFSRNRRY